VNPREFVEKLGAANFLDTFNPYGNRCPVHDLNDAPSKRSQTLRAILEAAARTEIDALWIGRDLGYRGGRRTGLALTDDAHIDAHTRRWGILAERTTKGAAVSERTAKVIWRVLSQIDASIFLWNVFPFHPHEPGNPFSNRAHNTHERNAGEDILSELVLILKPKRLIAIGNDAARTAYRVARTEVAFQVRHPSYGGQSEFVSGIQRLYATSESDHGHNVKFA
jgi:uracil-DNA glycosylase